MSLDEKASHEKTYKIRLSSGRILGPLTLDRIALLISKKRITGVETVRAYPDGEWKDINQISELADLLVLNIAEKFGNSKKQATDPEKEKSNFYGATAVLPGASKVLSEGNLKPLPELKTLTQQISAQEEAFEEEDKKTTIMSDVEKKILDLKKDIEETKLHARRKKQKATEESPSSNELLEIPSPDVSKSISDEIQVEEEVRNVASEKTVVFQRSTEGKRLPGKKPLAKNRIQLIILVLVLAVWNYFFDDNDSVKFKRAPPVRPSLPEYVQGRLDPKKSMQFYNEAIKKYYLLDNVEGYKKAAGKLKQSASYDVTNVKALAMLASSYINLIDSSNKDEKYFSIISKLIDMSRAKAIDLPETVIADVEFFITVNKIEAAQSRIIEYTTLHTDYGLEMFFYIAWVSYLRGEFTMAAKYINQLPEDKVYSARIFHLRGLIAEQLNDPDAALLEYKKAIKQNKQHAKSYLRIIFIMSRSSRLKEAAAYLDFLMKHPELLSPQDLALAYYLNALLYEVYEKWDFALGNIERAVKLDPDNHDYLLELYTLRAKAGDPVQTIQKQARMYYFLGEGEKLIQQGKYQDALVPLLQARESNDKSPVPLIKIGDMFNNLGDIENAKMNYKLAVARAPNDILVWSKYIQSLIQSYEWEEAKKAMEKFRKLPVSQSTVDIAAANMYHKQGEYIKADMFYKKAMERESIDPDVYIAYAKNLMSLNNYKDAPFFFSLALRFDPLNINAIILTAQCIAETESVDKAIAMLQDKLKQRNGTRSEFLAAIAEFQMKKGAWDDAQTNVNEAMKVNPEYAYPWKLQAKIYLNKEGHDKEALNKALYAYKSYSDRNASDPSGYLERYKIFMKKLQFDKAKEELIRVYNIFPKYPNLHYYMGVLYSIQGNHPSAAKELKLELDNNPNNLQSLLAFGKELMDLGDYDQALKQFTVAMQVAPGSSEAKHYAGWVNRFLKNYNAAITLIQAAQAIDKANPLLFKRIAIVYRDMGDTTAACGFFKKYLELEPDAQDKKEFDFCF